MAEVQEDEAPEFEEALEEQELPEAPEPEEGEEAPEFSIELEGEDTTEEPPLVKQLRNEIRDRDRELSAYRKTEVQKIDPGKEPDLWDDCEGDPDIYKQKLLEWTAKKQAADNQESEAQKQVEVRNQEHQRKFIQYRAAAQSLPVKDFAEAESAVISVLPETPDRPFQQALLAYTKDPAKLVYALGKHPQKLAQLAQETDVMRFVLSLHDMEGKLKVTTRAKPPAPEGDTVVRSSAPVAYSGDKKMEQLEKEAARTGDRTKIIAHKRAMKEKGK